jgi:hypothetical protein
MRTKAILLYFSLIIFFIAISQVAYGLYTKATFMDFYAYYGAGEVFREGVSPYPLEYNSPPGKILFIYPPGSLLYFFAPISILPFNISLILFTLISFSFLIISVFLTFELLEKKEPLYFKLIITALVIQTLPAKFCLASGQINIFPLFFTILSLYFLKLKREGSSALSMAVGVTFKLFPLAIIPLFLIRRKFKWLVYFAFFLIVINIFDLSLLSEYIQKIAVPLFSPAQSAISISNPWNQSIHKLFKTLFGEVKIPYLTYAIWGMIYLIILFRKRKESLLKKSVVLLSLVSILFKTSWQHYLVLNYPFFIVFFRKFRYFIPIWIIFMISFNYGDEILTKYPIISSYQVILIIILIGMYIFEKKSKI